MKKLLITTPIYYINAAPHIGSATTCVLADFFKRIYTLRGYDVYLSTGTDENGQKIQKANELHEDFNAFRNHNALLFKNAFDKLQVSYDRFIRTTEEDHHKMVIKVWNMLKEHIYEGTYKGYYCVSDETFYTEKDLKVVNNKYYTKDEKLAEYMETSAYFLRLNNIKEQMLTFYKNHSDFTYPEKKVNELIAFIDEGFRDLCISRQDNIGIHIPNSTHTIYVWFDALINYLTVSSCVIEDDKIVSYGYWNNVIHLMGKDVLIFHGLFWIAMLSLAGLIPQNIRIFTHNWWLLSKDKKEVKMSKSLGNVVSPEYLIEKYGVSCVRFYFIFINLINSDANFDEDQMVNSFNKYMVGKFSNLVHRIYSILNKQNIECTEVKNNEKYENILLNCDLDINKYVKTLFAWCDELNETVNNKRVWENISLTKEIAKELNSLYKYFIPIAPEVEKGFKNKHLTPIFKTIVWRS